jgi:hypothetical protein
MVRPFRAFGHDWPDPCGRPHECRPVAGGLNVQCAGCREPGAGSSNRTSSGTQHERIEVRTQFASPDLIGAIVYDGFDPIDDPAWRTSGATEAAEYAYWSQRCCGMACLQMILQHRDGTAPDLLPLLHGARRHGAYIPQADGTVKGMIYAPFVEHIQSEFGLTGEVHPRLGLDELLRRLGPVQQEGQTGPGRPWFGRMVVASVHREIRRPDRPAPDRGGGHLVLVTGHDTAEGTISFVNPSGHTPAARAARLPTGVFERFYAERAVTVTLTRR